MILMDGVVIYKRGETYGRNMLYFILLGVCGFEDVDRLYLYVIILQREDAYGTLGDLRNDDIDLRLSSKLLIF